MNKYSLAKVQYLYCKSLHLYTEQDFMTKLQQNFDINYSFSRKTVIDKAICVNLIKMLSYVSIIS